MTKFKVEAPNKIFNGVRHAYGETVQFENGKAEVTNEKVAKLFESWNYVVTKVEEKKAPTKKAPQKKTQNKK